jgi:hypothetical protein
VRSTTIVAHRCHEASYHNCQEMPSVPSLPGNELVADKDNAALETLVVYQSETSKECGHSFKMIPFMDYLERGHLKSICPTCQGPIEMVCDGMVPCHDTTTTTTNSSLDSTHDIPVVKFKHRNHMYQLAVMRATNSVHLPQTWFLWIWHAMLHFVGETTAITAQERIATVLQLDMQNGMRVRKT